MALFDRKSSPSRERTREERERARAERAARRAGLPPEQAVSPPLETPPTAPEPPRPSREASAGTGGGASRAVPEAPRPAPRPAVVQAPRAPAAPRAAAAPERHSPVLDDAVAEDWSGMDAPPPRDTPRRWPLALLIAAVVAILAGGWFLMSLFQPLHGDGGARVSVSIPRGAGVSQAGDVLAERGVISSAFFFKLRAKLDGTNDVKPGNYTFAQDTSYGDALTALAKGPPPPKTTDVTITEGRTIVEANRLLRRTSLRGSYAAAATRATTLRPQQFGAPRSIRTKEGFLFPATYKVRVGAPVSDLVAKQLQTFRKEFAKVDLTAAKRRGLSPYEVVIVASMIEREASVAKDRRLISSVIYNRLAQSIPLGIDATIRYQLDNWQRPLRMSELARDTPYNTRLHQGLPPTPIGNPGLASLRAAANPARTDFLYFVVKPCGKGEHAFTKTDAEFQRAVQRYEQERRRQGRSPVDC